jgi:photosynthetic reaction center cytochrome c subunit
MRQVNETLRASTAALALLLVGGCFERPPVDSEQLGYRGTGMVQITNPRLTDVVPEIPVNVPMQASAGPKAGEIYQNVQVLGDLSVAEFTGLMTAVTSWVAPEQGCNYCHISSDLASDDIYTKVVSRRMIQMTQYLNEVHGDHVGGTGVTCYTCHRGNNVPEVVWTENAGPPAAQGAAGWRDGQNVAGQESAAYSALPVDPFSRFLEEEAVVAQSVRVVSTTALPVAGQNTAGIKDTEWTYSLMTHLSESLGVNCTYCHNTRSFASWEQSNPTRLNAWHGLRMVADINEEFLIPLRTALPENRLGLQGDAPKANCGTCHQGQPKPLGGVAMLPDYPSLSRR